MILRLTVTLLILAPIAAAQVGDPPVPSPFPRHDTVGTGRWWEQKESEIVDVRVPREDYGRDHHPLCPSGWVAGGGFKGGITYGNTDDFSYNVVQDPVNVRDLHATMLHQLGIDHERLVFPFQGLDQRLTGVEPAAVLKAILS